LAAIGQAVGQVGDLSFQLFEQEMESRVFGALAGATTDMNNLLMEVEKEPDHNKREALYEKGASGISNKYRDTLSYPAYQNLFDENFFDEMEGGRVRVANNVRQASIASIRANDLLWIETQQDKIEREPDAGRRADMLRMTLGRIASGVADGRWGPEESASLQIRQQDRFDTNELLVNTYAMADALYQDYPDPEKRREAIRSLPASMRDPVSGIVEDRYRKEQAHEKEANDAQYIGLMQQAKKSMTQPELNAAVLRLQDTDMPLTPAQWEKLSGIITERENKGKTLEGKGEAAVLYSQLLRLAQDPTRRQEFLKMNLRVEFGHILDDGDLKALETDQKQGASTLDSTSDDAINVALSIMRLPVTNGDFKKANAKDRGRALLFRERTVAALNQAASENQAPLPPSRVHEIVNGMQDVVTLEEKNYWPDTTAPLWEITEEQFQEIVNVPEEAADIIRKAEGLGEANDIDTLREIRDIYVRILRERQQGRDAPFGVERLGW